jgi:DNA-binding IclR family transcriptional regulator
MIESMTPKANEAFDRLQQLLLTMRVGDDLRAGDAAHATGLSEHLCRAVLEGLTRAGLMTQAEDDRFVRCTLDLLT